MYLSIIKIIITISSISKLSKMTLSITKLSIMRLNTTNFNIMTLIIAIKMTHYATFAIKLIMLSVIMPNVVVPSVFAPSLQPPKSISFLEKWFKSCFEAICRKVIKFLFLHKLSHGLCAIKLFLCLIYHPSLIFEGNFRNI